MSLDTCTSSLYAFANQPDAGTEMNNFEKEYARYSWRRWEYGAREFASLKSAAPPIPCKHGVYLIRCPVPLPRVRGTSTVIYIGQSGGGKRGGQQGIGPGNGGPGRLFNRRGRDKLVREMIEKKKGYRSVCFGTGKPSNSIILSALVVGQGPGRSR